LHLIRAQRSNKISPWVARTNLFVRVCDMAIAREFISIHIITKNVTVHGNYNFFKKI